MPLSLASGAQRVEPGEWAPHLAQIIITMSAGSEFCTNKYHSVWSLMSFGHYSLYDKCKLPSHQMKMFPESQETTLSGNIYVNADKSLTRTNIESPTLCRAVNVVGTNLNLVTCGFIVLFMKTFINVLSWGSILQFCNITRSHPHMSHLEPLTGHLYHRRSSHCPRSLPRHQEPLDLGWSSVPKYCHKNLNVRF